MLVLGDGAVEPCLPEDATHFGLDAIDFAETELVDLLRRVAGGGVEAHQDVVVMRAVANTAQADSDAGVM